MSDKKILFLVLLCLIAIPIVKAEKPAISYVWSKSGIPLYASSSQQSTPIDTLVYGFAIEDVEQLSTLEEIILLSISGNEEENPETSRSYVHQSKWYRIRYQDVVGYVLDTYLMPIPPPLAPDSYTPIHEYLSQIAEVVGDQRIGQTEKFCSQEKYRFSNGARYSFIDVGPCESCGRSIEETYLPGLDVHQGFLFTLTLHHIDLEKDSPYQSETVYFYPQADGSLRFSSDYTEYTVSKQQKGVLIHNDTSL